MDDLIHYGEVHKAWIGIFVQDLDQNLVKYFDLKRKEGVIVTSVFKDSPAEKSGLEKGDLIIKIAGQVIEAREDYVSILAGYTSGDKIPMAIMREKEKKEISVTASDIPLEIAEEVTLNWLGIKYREIALRDAVQLRLSDRRGVIVTEVVQSRSAVRAGIRSGDIIRQVNNQMITGEEDFRKAIVAATQYEGLLLMVQRGPYIYPVTLQP